MMPSFQFESFVERCQFSEPKTALPAMLLGGGMSLLLWSLLGQLLLTFVR